MTDHCVPVADEAEHGFELRPLHVLAGCFVEEGPVKIDAFELPLLMLVDRAHADLSNPLTLRVSLGPLCCDRFFELRHLV